MISILRANFRDDKESVIYTSRLHQYDTGVVLRISGIPLPEHYQVHFSNTDRDGVGHSVVASGSDVAVPDVYLSTGKYVYVWLYLAEDRNKHGVSAYEIVIPVTPRPAFIPLSYDGEGTTVSAIYDEEEHALIFVIP